MWYKGKSPTYMQPQRPESDPVQQTLMVDKLSKVLERRYFEYGDIASLTQFFKVSKGKCDIRMVHNGTSSGLNDWLWVTWFPLRTITTLARSVEVGTHMGDLDVGEMFLNFILELKARVSAGVDLTHFIAFSENVSADKETPRTTRGEPETSQAANVQQGAKPSGSSATKKSLKREHESIERETAKRARQAGRPPLPFHQGVKRKRETPGDSGNPTKHLCRWGRCLMVATSSPYQTVQVMGFMKEVTLGDRKDPANVFRWEKVRLNLPTTQGCDPMIPWVSKRRKEGVLAADFFTYMDDMRPLAPSYLECWKATSRVSSMCNHLGIQHTARKQRGSSTTPGP
jgi:hypothetical protein